MTKRLLSLLFTLVVTVGVMFLVNTKSYAGFSYNAEAALEYAEANWDSGVGLCAEYVSKCLNAGGTDIENIRVCTLYDELLAENYGKPYELTISDNNKISLAENLGKVQAGDPLFYYCNVCEEFPHVVLCNGANSEGYLQDYAHNSAHDGHKTTYAYTHSGCGTNDWTIYSVRMYSVNDLYGKLTGVPAPVVKSVSNVADGVEFKWSKVEGAKVYRVYREGVGDKKPVLIAKVTETKYIDKTAKNGQEYTYTVRAGNGSAISPYYAGESIQYLKPVIFNNIKNTRNGISISWYKNQKCDGYRIYRKVNSGKWGLYQTVEGKKITEYVDSKIKSGNVYSYRIRAYTSLALGSTDFNEVQTNFLGTPVLENARNTVNGIAFNWNVVKGATEYNVMRKADDEKKWTLIATVNENCFVDGDVESGVCYRYTVKAKNDTTKRGYDVKGVLIKCLSAPEISKVKITNNGISLVWNEVGGSTGYYVYKKTDVKKSWEKIAKVKKGTAYTDSDVKKNKTYIYSVKAFDEKTKSAYAAGVEVKNQKTKK